MTLIIAATFHLVPHYHDFSARAILLCSVWTRHGQVLPCGTPRSACEHAEVDRVIVPVSQSGNWALHPPPPPPPAVSVVQPANLGTADCLAWEPEVITQAILLWISSALLEIPFQFPPVCTLSYTLPPSLWSSVLSLSHTLRPSETKLISQSRLPFLQRLWHVHSSSPLELDLDHPFAWPAGRPHCLGVLGSHPHPEAGPALFLCVATLSVFPMIENTNSAAFLFSYWALGWLLPNLLGPII